MGFGNKTRFERCIFYEHQMDKKVTTPVGNSCSILEKNGTDAKISTSWVFECYGWLMLLDIDLWFVRIAQWIRRFSNALCIFEIVSNFNCISSLTFTFLTKCRITYTYEFMRTFNRKRYSLQIFVFDKKNSCYYLITCYTLIFSLQHTYNYPVFSICK